MFKTSIPCFFIWPVTLVVYIKGNIGYLLNDRNKKLEEGKYIVAPIKEQFKNILTEK